MMKKTRELRVSDPSAVGSAIISGGEPTVDLSEAAGQGGRNQHLVLSAMLHLLDDQPKLGDFSFLSAEASIFDSPSNFSMAVNVPMLLINGISAIYVSSLV